MKNIINKIKQIKVNPRYDIKAEDLMSILEYCKGNSIKGFHYCFLIGYMQGIKAEKARHKYKLQNRPTEK